MLIFLASKFCVLRPNHTTRQIAVIYRGDNSPCLHCCCDKAAYAYFVAVMCRTNSNQFEFVRQIAATKFCCSDYDFHISHQAVLLHQRVSPPLGIVLHLLSIPVIFTSLGVQKNVVSMFADNHLYLKKKTIKADASITAMPNFKFCICTAPLSQ